MVGLMELPTSSVHENSEAASPPQMKFSVPRGGVLIIDKPEGWTSHDVVARSRRLLGEKRIGHTGTLDPMATGVLVLLVGKATRLAPYLACDRKTYTCTARFGIFTDTQDITGQIIDERDASQLTSEMIERALPQFRGAIRQRPPQYSAVKVDGKKLYQSARKGEHVDVPERDIEVTRFDLVSWNSSGEKPSGYFVIECSAGTYVRTLLHDLGAALGVGATLTSLRRTSAGRFSLDDAASLEEITSSIDSETGRSKVLPMEQLVGGLSTIRVSQQDVEQIYFGRSLPAECVFGEGLDSSLSDGVGQNDIALVHDSLGLVALGKIASGRIQPHLVFVEATSVNGIPR